MTLTLITTITSFISAGGYPALLLLTFLDSTVLPVPNEAIMPFAGFLIFSGRFSFFGVLLTSTVGAVLGASTSYFIGFYGATPFVQRFGKYLRVTEADLNKTNTFFACYGEKIILVSRFIPVVRQFISIPAGAAKMSFSKFCLFTAIGSLLWNSIIVWFGYTLGANWETLNKYTKYFDIAIIGAVVLFIFFLFWKKRNKINSVP